MARGRERHVDLARLNQERVLRGEGSPKILIGGINVEESPNFHTLPLIEMGASIVSITDNPYHRMRPERMYVTHEASIMEAWGAWPRKWYPDFFWNPQCEHGHWFPIGLGEIPIPTIASFVHAHLGDVLLHLRGMFDCLIAPHPFMSKWGDAVLPWGASWGTLGERVRSMVGEGDDTEKDIDISCTLSPSGLGEESVRTSVIETVRALGDERPDLRVVVAHGLTQENYYDVLRRSKVVVNVGNWGNPMTYRPLEAIECLAAVVHVDETSYGSRASMKEYDGGGWCQVVGVDGVREAALEELAAYSTTEAKMDRGWLESEYSYEAQYERLFRLAATVKRGVRYSIRDWSRHAFAVNYLAGFPEIAQFHVGALTDEDKETVQRHPREDGWDISLWQPEKGEKRTRWRTELARGEDDVNAIYERYL